MGEGREDSPGAGADAWPIVELDHVEEGED